MRGFAIRLVRQPARRGCKAHCIDFVLLLSLGSAWPLFYSTNLSREANQIKSETKLIQGTRIPDLNVTKIN
jgi:hypothetical protein